MSELFFNESVILLDVEGDNKEEVLATISNNLVERGLVKESFVPAIIKREGEFATGLPTAGVSVAIPHTDVEHVNKKTISIAVLKNPVDFVIMGDDSETTPVQLVFMLAMDEAHSQLSLLQKLMQVFQEEDTLKYLVNQKDKTKIKSLLEEKLDFVALKGGER
ncbi:PTS sugar transporter subunit IIA [Oceanobacillus polygoni]|uniref:PTS system galactitol-specific IIA component n=1 Tax=Oceanobacillus polygoni TaxID=1235259 RepID=A0A9X0YSD9_9BACI|nr:PTS sugar transporter subunit IIA [Oceanobacillus polygoni]MBP2076126.1 PTS system galactitol-specific IIA component [Oceanobacillus polygoni]